MALLLTSAGGPDFVTRRNKFGLTAADLVRSHRLAWSLPSPLWNTYRGLQLNSTVNAQAVLQSIQDGQSVWEVRFTNRICSFDPFRAVSFACTVQPFAMQDRRAKLVALFYVFLCSPAVQCMPTELRSLIFRHVVPARPSRVPAPEQAGAPSLWMDLGAMSDTESEGFDGSSAGSDSESDSESLQYAAETG